ncbi:hypothetical protein [Rhodospirillum sp. A1_3_36]|uniref:hypothetical protein n=1 Tax=Rhodospirillum sp. A1_3_36 TaxID=3391666 RepID=UPI0039A43FFF
MGFASRDRIQDIIALFLVSDEDGLGANLAEIREMSDILEDWAGISLKTQIDPDPETKTCGGKAVTPVTAGRCAWELMRTQRFLRGVHGAILDGLARRNVAGKDGPLEILYAGSGPFGTLVLPLLHYFSARDVQVTLLDIHQVSVEAVEKVIAKLGVQDRIRAVDCVDILQWTPPEPGHYDIIVSETMTRALKGEAQVAIFAHLAPSLKPEGTLIPQEIRLDGWTEGPGDSRADRVPLGRLFTLNHQTALAIGRGEDAPLVVSLAAEGIPETHDVLGVSTEIQVWGQHVLREGECSLTGFHRMKTGALKDCGLVKGRYVLGREPYLDIDYADLLQRYVVEPAEPEDRSLLGVPGLMRQWSKIQLEKLGRLDRDLRIRESEGDWRRLSILNLDPVQSLSVLYSLARPSQLEDLILKANGGALTEDQLRALGVEEVASKAL